MSVLGKLNLPGRLFVPTAPEQQTEELRRPRAASRRVVGIVPSPVVDMTSPSAPTVRASPSSVHATWTSLARPCGTSGLALWPRLSRSLGPSARSRPSPHVTTPTSHRPSSSAPRVPALRRGGVSDPARLPRPACHHSRVGAASQTRPSSVPRASPSSSSSVIPASAAGTQRALPPVHSRTPSARSPLP